MTIYDREGRRLGRFNSIASAAREIQEPGDQFDILCACISSVAHGKGNFVKDKYMFSYKDQECLLRVLSRSYPVICIESDGTEIVYQNADQAAKVVKGKPSGIHKVLRGERNRYKGLIWKIGSGFKIP